MALEQLSSNEVSSRCCTHFCLSPPSVPRAMLCPQCDTHACPQGMWVDGPSHGSALAGQRAADPLHFEQHCSKLLEMQWISYSLSARADPCTQLRAPIYCIKDKCRSHELACLHYTCVDTGQRAPEEGGLASNNVQGLKNHSRVIFL